MNTSGSEEDVRPWARLVLPQIENDALGIYSWIVEDVGTYVGKSCNLKRRLREYPNNLRKMVLHLPYRNSKPRGFRRIHRELLSGLSMRRNVQCQIIELCDRSLLSERERYWISKVGTLNGRIAELGGINV